PPRPVRDPKTHAFPMAKSIPRGVILVIRPSTAATTTTTSTQSWRIPAMATVKPIPPGYTTVTPSITVSDATKAIEFYKKAFGAVEKGRFKGPDGKIMHAEIEIGNSKFMLNDEVMGMRSPQSYGGSPPSFYLYFEDAHAACRRAIAAGGKQAFPVPGVFGGG